MRQPPAKRSGHEGRKAPDSTSLGLKVRLHAGTCLGCLQDGLVPVVPSSDEALVRKSNGQDS